MSGQPDYLMPLAPISSRGITTQNAVHWPFVIQIQEIILG